jgi:hypothetical protein
MGSVTLWAGEDHLMLVELRGFTETYRRFYFKDVQAIVVRPTDRARTRSILLGLLGLALAGVAMGAGRGWNVLWGSLAGLAIVALAVNLALGRGCECSLRTALQEVDLRSLRRLRRARRVVDRLRSLIELEQGALAGDELAARVREAAAPPVAVVAPGTPSAGTAPGPPVVAESPTMARCPAVAPPPVVPGAPWPPILRPDLPLRCENGRAHEALAYVLLLSAVVDVVPVIYFNLVLNASLGLVFLGRLACIVTALARQNRSDLPLAMKRFAWAALGRECVIMVLGFVNAVIVIVQMFDSGIFNPESATPPSPLAIMDLMKNNPRFKIMALLSSGASLVLGVWGLVLHRRLRLTGREPWHPLPT